MAKLTPEERAALQKELADIESAIKQRTAAPAPAPTPIQRMSFEPARVPAQPATGQPGPSYASMVGSRVMDALNPLRPAGRAAAFVGSRVARGAEMVGQAIKPYLPQVTEDEALQVAERPFVPDWAAGAGSGMVNLGSKAVELVPGAAGFLGQTANVMGRMASGDASSGEASGFAKEMFQPIQRFGEQLGEAAGAAKMEGRSPIAGVGEEIARQGFTGEILDPYIAGKIGMSGARMAGGLAGRAMAPRPPPEVGAPFPQAPPRVPVDWAVPEGFAYPGAEFPAPASRLQPGAPYPAAPPRVPLQAAKPGLARPLPAESAGAPFPEAPQRVPLQAAKPGLARPIPEPAAFPDLGAPYPVPANARVPISQAPELRVPRVPAPPPGPKLGGVEALPQRSGELRDRRNAVGIADALADEPASKATPPTPPGDPNNFLEEATGAQALREGKKTGRAAPGADKDSVVREGRRPIPDDQVADPEADAARAAAAASIAQGGGAKPSRQAAGRARQEERMAEGAAAGSLVQEGAAGGSVNPPGDLGPGEPNGGAGRLNPNAQLSSEGLGGKVRSMLTGWTSPQYDPFLNETGVVKAVAESGVGKRQLSSRYIRDVAETPEKLKEMRAYFEENPIAHEVAANLRERKPLDAEQQAFLQQRGAEFMPFVEKVNAFYDMARTEKLPQLREMGIDVGDLGETYLPYRYRSFGDLIQTFGENWRQRFREPNFAERILPNLEKHRTPGARRPAAGNYASDFESYANQLAEAETMKPLSREIAQMTKKWREGSKRLEAEKVEGYARANMGSGQSAVDAEWMELNLRDIAQQKVTRGMKVQSGGQWMPEGTFEVVGPAKRAGKYEVLYEGETKPRQASEIDILAAKYAKTPMYKAVTGLADRMSRLSSFLVVGGRLKSGVTSVISNVARTAISESNANLMEGMKKFWETRPKSMGGEGYSQAKLQEYFEQGIHDNTLRAITENPNDFMELSKWEQWYFSNVTKPDVWSKEILYESRKAGLRKEHPDWTEQQVRNAATVHASRFADMAIDGMRAEKAQTPGGKMLYHLVAAPMREVQLFIENVRKGDYRAAAKQGGIKAAGIAALVAANGGDPEDFARGIIESVPIVGSGLTRGDTVSWNAPGIILERAGKLATGDVAGAMPGSIQQFYSDGRKK